MSFNKSIKPAKDIDALRRSAFWHLQRRDHSEQELRVKLARKTDNQQWIDAVIGECLEYNYLNDTRFVEYFIRSSQNKGFGAARISRDLQGKGFSTNVLDNAFAEIEFDYVTSAVALLTKKYNRHLSSPILKQKAMAFLQGKGHALENIFKAIELHNEFYPVAECNDIDEAIVLLACKFKTEINERNQRDKAFRFLLSRGYRFDDIQDAIQAHNKQKDTDESETGL
jgi:regulatory protein